MDSIALAPDLRPLKYMVHTDQREVESSRIIWLPGLSILLLVGAVAGYWFYFAKTNSGLDHVSPIDHTSMSHTQSATTARNDGSSVNAGEPPLIDRTEAPIAPPDGMIWVPAGEFSMGTQEPMFTDTRPIHRVAVRGFWIDKTEVTNEEFADFVKATGYVTVAERKPRAEDFPGVPAEKLVAGSIVFSPPKQAVPLGDYMQWWSYVAGANWRHPEGPRSDLNGREKHPVVHIAWDDANAFAKWAGKRLPTEAEFEWAARGGLDRKKYAWGEDFKPGDRFQANTFQGNFPNNNTGEDGFLATAPVGSFEPNSFGLYDVAGNVWEWCSDWYRADYYQTLAGQGSIARNPAGPADSSDPNEPGVPKRVTKGGSFLCTDQYCSRYMPGGRGKEAPDTGTNHLGFRLVRDAQ